MRAGFSKRPQIFLQDTARKISQRYILEEVGDGNHIKTPQHSLPAMTEVLTNAK